MDLYSRALELHEKNRGKIRTEGKVAVETTEDLSLAYSPGVAAPCRSIAKNRAEVYRYTNKGNTVAVVTDGSAVLGLGNIGACASLPVMEGKVLLFHEFADIDGYPICLETQDTAAIVSHVKAIAPSFGGINLEDISAPRCFEIEDRLRQELDIPVFHDDQHGTAVVTFAGILNGLKIVGKSLAELRVTILGAGAAGVAIAKLITTAGCQDITLVDRQGIIGEHRSDLNDSKKEMARLTNPRGLSGGLAEAVHSCDVFIGVSAANQLTPEMVASMHPDSMVFALANPEPEIDPEVAKQAGCRIVATGRSDFPNQVNNVLGFPGIFRGALDVQASDITHGMNLAAAEAIASIIPEGELRDDYIIPLPFDTRVVPKVAEAVARAAQAEGVARLKR